MRTLRVKVVRVKGHCPVYNPGDEFLILRGYKLRTEKELCLHALASLFPWYVALSRGAPPKDLGLGNQETAYIQCPDPCEYTGGGTVVFELKRLGDE